jgi:hypothetical protein
MSENDGATAPEKFAEILAPLRAKYGAERIAAFPVGIHGVLVVRHATGTEARRNRKLLREFQKNNNDEGIEGLDAGLVQTCAVHPTTREEVVAIIEDYPTLVPKVARAIIRISGDGVEELPKG